MHRIFESLGTLRPVKDFNGDPIEHDGLTRNVLVRASYELKPSPQQSFVVEIYGYDLISGGGQWTDELTLENGLVLRGRCSGGMNRRRGEPREVGKMQMHDVSVESEGEDAWSKIILNPNDRPSPPRSNDVDAVVFGVVGKTTLGSNGVARPGLPFSHRGSGLAGCRRTESPLALPAHVAPERAD